MSLFSLSLHGYFGWRGGVMAGDELAWATGWAVRLRVWLENAGRAVLGPEQVELLRAIDADHSISGAARRVGVSYRKAWLLVAEMNAAAGVALVVARTGGPGGGGAGLTEQGRQALTLFARAQERLGQAAGALRPATTPAADAAVHVAAAVSLEEVLAQLVGDYARAVPGIRVRSVFGASDELADRLLAGAPADLFLAASAAQLELLSRHGLVEGRLVLLAANALAGVAAPGHELPIRTPRDLLGPGVGRVALAGPSCPLGDCTRAFLQARGLYEAVMARALVVDNSRAVLDALRGGHADAGLAYASAARAAGCRVLFRVGRPAVPVVYAGAVLRHARRGAEARRLLEFLASPPAARRFRRCGFLPPPCRRGQGPEA
jgi:molybdenum ABC transporter molybdate-binding protein